MCITLNNASTFLLMFMTFEGFSLTFVSRLAIKIQEFVTSGKDKMILDICHMIECLEIIFVMRFPEILG